MKLFKNITAMALAGILLISAAACGTPQTAQSPAAPDSGKTEVRAFKGFTMGVAPQVGMDEYYAALDALTIPDLNMTIRFDHIPWGDEKNRINLNIASGEYDLYIGGNFSDYKSMAAQNAFKDLNPLLQYVPDLYAHYTVLSDQTLKTHEVAGGLYGIPQFGKPTKGGGQGEGMIFREDLRKEWGLPEITSIETAEQYLIAAQTNDKYKNQAQIIDNRFWTAVWNMLAQGKYMEIDSGNILHYAVVAVDDPYTVVCIYDTPEWKQVLEYAKKWYEMGIVDHDILAASDNETAKAAELLKADMKVAELNSPMWSFENSIIAPIYNEHPEWEMGWYDYTYKRAPLYLPSVTNASAISISSRLDDESAIILLKFLEKAHTDQTYYDLLMYGIEGTHYVRTEEGWPTRTGIDTANIKPSLTALNDGYMNFDVPSSNPAWQAIKNKMVEEGDFPTEYSPLDGFSFNTTNLSVEMANMEQVRLQYLQPLRCGVTKDIEGDMAKVLNAYGNDLTKYLDELQKQLTAFKESKK